MSPSDPESPGDAARALARLQAADGAPLRQLARIVVDQATATPLRDLASERWIASQLATALEAATRGDTLRNALDERLQAAKGRWADEQRPLGDFVPDEVMPPLRKLMSRPYTPSPRMTQRIVRQPVVRDLLANVLEDSVSAFGHRMRSADDRLGGLGRRASQRGRSLGKGLLAAAGVAEMASGLAHAVTEEFEHALEKRVKEYVGDATSKALEHIVAQLSDPSQADKAVAFRLSLLDEVLETPVKELISEVDGVGPLDVVDIVIEAVRAELAREGFVDRVEVRVQQAFETAGDGTLGAWLDEVELREVWVETTTELVASRLQAVVHSEPFLEWWAGLFRAG